jgi:ribosomal protein L33
LARDEIRPIVKLRSTADTGYTYVTRKNRRNDPDRLVLPKYDPVIRRHVDFREIVARYAERRAELKQIIRSPASTADERAGAQGELTRQPRDASPVRVRELAHEGHLPGVRKSSW